MLSALRQDHTNFALLLDAAEREADLICGGGRPNLALLEDIVAYFHSYLDEHHHAKENLIYGLLMQHMPGFGSHRLPILEEHLHLANETARFDRALADCDIGTPQGRDVLCREARAFITQERDHMHAEEEHIFPAAERWLKAEHWAEVGRVVTPKQDAELKALNASLDRLLKSIKTTVTTD